MKSIKTIASTKRNAHPPEKTTFKKSSLKVKAVCEQSCRVVDDRKIFLTRCLPPEKQKKRKAFCVWKRYRTLLNIVIYRKCVSKKIKQLAFSLTFTKFKPKTDPFRKKSHDVTRMPHCFCGVICCTKIMSYKPSSY